MAQIRKNITSLQKDWKALHPTRRKERFLCRISSDGSWGLILKRGDALMDFVCENDESVYTSAYRFTHRDANVRVLKYLKDISILKPIRSRQWLQTVRDKCWWFRKQLITGQTNYDEVNLRRLSAQPRTHVCASSCIWKNLFMQNYIWYTY